MARVLNLLKQMSLIDQDIPNILLDNHSLKVDGGRHIAWYVIIVDRVTDVFIYP